LIIFIIVIGNNEIEGSPIKKKIPSYLKATASSAAKRSNSLAGSPRGSPIPVRRIQTEAQGTRGVSRLPVVVKSPKSALKAKIAIPVIDRLLAPVNLARKMIGIHCLLIL
jgi:hypothetical protein